MRTTEGVGRVAPKPVIVRLTTADLELARRVVERRNAFRGYECRADQWGRGLIRHVDPIMVGTVGEIAFALWCNRTLKTRLRLDDADRRTGDGGRDFDLGGACVQVKTATNRYTDLLLRTTELTDQTWDACVRAHWPTIADPDDRLAVALCGWVRPMEVMRRGRLEPARRGTHVNYAVDAVDFNSMASFADNIRALRALLR